MLVLNGAGWLLLHIGLWLLLVAITPAAAAPTATTTASTFLLLAVEVRLSLAFTLLRLLHRS